MSIYIPAAEQRAPNYQSCWVNASEHIISFHEVAGYTQKEFASPSEEWTFVHNKINNGYRVM